VPVLARPLRFDASRITHCILMQSRYVLTVRTTVDLERGLLHRAKRLALKEGRTLSSLLASALAAYLGSRQEAAKDEPFELIVRGNPDGRFPSPTEIADVEDEEAVAALRIPRPRKRVAP
jgi:hypothetical protein